MTIRAKFKIDSIDSNHRHIDYARDEKGKPDMSKPTCEKTATVSLSAVDPGNDPEHLNSKIWKGRANGRLVVTGVDEAVVGHLAIGQEYFIDITAVG